jgi:hypothetical protein
VVRIALNIDLIKIGSYSVVSSYGVAHPQQEVVWMSLSHGYRLLAGCYRSFVGDHPWWMISIPAPDVTADERLLPGV